MAFTHADRLFLFELTASGGLVLAAETQALTANAAPASASGTDVAKSSETPSDGRSDGGMTRAHFAWVGGLLAEFPSRIPAGRQFQFHFSLPEQASIELMSEIAGVTLTPVCVSEFLLNIFKPSVSHSA